MLEAFFLLLGRKWGQFFILGKGPIQILEIAPRAAEPGERNIRWETEALLSVRSAGKLSHNIRNFSGNQEDR